MLQPVVKKTLTTQNKFNGTNTRQFIILHHTATGEGSIEWVLKTLTVGEVSCHYVVDTNGDCYKIGNDTDILRHAGESSRGSLKNMNSYSIGIETIGPLADWWFTDAQRKTVSDLIKYLCDCYKIPKENILRHKDIAPKRKVDIYDSFWIGQFKTRELYKSSLFNMITPDVKDTDRYAQAVKRGIECGITSASPTKNFEPDRTATRAEVMQFLKNFYDFMKKSWSIK